MRVFLIIGGLIVLAFVTALVAPPYIDWNQYQSRFEAEASRALGLAVKVRGQTSVRLLPLPSISFSNLSIAETEENAPLLTAENFQMDVEIFPLLKGEVVVADIILQQPAINIALDEKGQVMLPLMQSSSMDLKGDDVALKKIIIVDGAVNVIDKRYNRVISVKEMQAEASAQTLTGPWHFDSTLMYEKEAVHVTLSTGVWQADENQITLKATAMPRSLPYDLIFDGPLQKGKEGFVLNGKVRTRPMIQQKASEVAAFQRPDAKTALPIWAEADVNLTTGNMTIPAFKLDVGDRIDPYTVTGSGKVHLSDPPSFVIRAEGRQVNVDRLSPTQSAGLDFSARLKLLEGLLKQMPQFEGDGEISFYLPAVVAGDTVIRDVGMDLRPLKTGQGWQVKNVEAQLPGRTMLYADGALHLKDELSYRGELLVTSHQPSGLARWLGKKPDPAIRSLRAVGFSAHSVISPKEVVLEALEISLDQRTMTGSIIRESFADKRPKITAELIGDGGDLDQLMALMELFTGGGSALEEQNTQDTQDKANQQQGLIQSHDMVLDLSVDALTFDGVEAKEVVAKIAYEEQKLTIEELNIDDYLGLELVASGHFDNLNEHPQGKMAWHLKGDDPSALLSYVQKRFGPYPLLNNIIARPYSIADAKWDGEIKADEKGYFFKLFGDAGGSQMDVRLTSHDVFLPFEKQKISFNAVLVNKTASGLLEQIGLPVVPASGLVNTGGRGALRVSFDGQAENGLNSGIALTLRDGYVSATGQVSLDRSDNQFMPRGSLTMVVDINDWDNLIILSGQPLPGFGEGYSGHLEGQLKFAQDVFTFEQARGTLGDMQFSADLEVDRAKKPRPLLKGHIRANHFDNISLAQLVFTPHLKAEEVGSVATEGGAIGPVLAGLDGQLKFDARQADISFLNAPLTNFKSDLSIIDGDLSFDAITAQLGKGRLRGDLNLNRTGTSQQVSGQLALEEIEAKALPQLVNIPDFLEGKITVNGRFESSADDLDKILSSVTGSGVVSLTGAQIRPLNAAALPSILNAADANESDEDVFSTKVDGLIETQLYKGSFQFTDTQLPFNINNGVLRMSNVRLKNDQLALQGAGRLNLNNQEADIKADLTFNAYKQAVVGASPEVRLSFKGPLTGIIDEIDTSLFSTYLGMRLSERREREFEGQRASILERQRLLNSAQFYRFKEQEALRIKKLKQQQAERRQRALEAEQQRVKAEKAYFAAIKKRQEEEQQRQREAARAAAEKRDIEQLLNEFEDSLLR